MTNETTKTPHCPRCGGEMVRKVTETLWDVGCGGCGFGAQGGAGLQAEGEVIARRLVRAELARQALEMRAHSEHFRDDDGFDRPALWASSLIVMTDYEWLGAHPLRLPGEEA